MLWTLTVLHNLTARGRGIPWQLGWYFCYSVVAICACRETGRGGLIHVWRLQEIPEGTFSILLLKAGSVKIVWPGSQTTKSWTPPRMEISPTMSLSLSAWPPSYRKYFLVTNGNFPNTGPTSLSQYWLSQIFWATFGEPLTPRDLILHLVQKENVRDIAQLGKNLLDSSLFSFLGTAEPVFCNSSLLVSVFLCFVVEVFVCFFKLCLVLFGCFLVFFPFDCFWGIFFWFPTPHTF